MTFRVVRTNQYNQDLGLIHSTNGNHLECPKEGKRVKVRRLSCRVSMTFRVVRTNQYNQDLGLIHSTNGNHLECPKEGSSIDHQVTIYLHAQNITMFPTNETWPKKEDRYKRDEKKEDRYRRDEKTDDRSKERSKDRRMRTRGDKRPSRKNDRKVLVAEESNRNWADTDSDASSSSSSSSDSEQEEVHCLMADQTSDDEVFVFSNIEFTREDLVSALNDMVKDYRKLSHTFEEVKAENDDLKNSSVEPSTVELGEADSLQIELNKLKAENELLRSNSFELKSEIEKLNSIMSSWTQSSISLDKLCEIQKPANDRTGLGFNTGESSSGETLTQSNLANDKFKKMGGGRYRQSGPRPETGFILHPTLEGMTRSAGTDSPRRVGRNKFRRLEAAAAAATATSGGGGGGD
ncbi:hypothetical protein F511_20995 [Dorcoceras hygrometricum]|uniref:Uncharacterized protein n=1 Tax=Dorcoceras hygrometricum TaxID=472368 RepID=A0A2Z7CUU2_9LAMI|nr:hypothetical protein F511_20995 [Dorcoceras hygrometricum]